MSIGVDQILEDQILIFIGSTPVRIQLTPNREFSKGETVSMFHPESHGTRQILRAFITATSRIIHKSQNYSGFLREQNFSDDDNLLGNSPELKPKQGVPPERSDEFINKIASYVTGR